MAGFEVFTEASYSDRNHLRGAEDGQPGRFPIFAIADNRSLILAILRSISAR
jgi:hypothetical protein